MEKTLFYDIIAEDSKQALIQLVSEAGHGKTSSLRTIISYIRDKHHDIVFKIFDVSQAWYHNAPTEYRQLVTLGKWQQGLIDNVEDCVYEMGQLSEEERRAFVGTILRQDWDHRYKSKLDGTLDDYPFMVYVFEESNIYFGSYAFRRNDEHTSVFQNFVSVGRNYKMRGFLIATAEQGEMSPSLRRRTRKIYGKLISKSDISSAKKTGVTMDLTKIPRYHFAYKKYVERIPDSVKHTPKDFVVTRVKVVAKNNSLKDNFWLGFIAPIVITLLFISYFLQ